MKKFLILLPLLPAFEKTVATVCFDPFADATANGGSSHTVGDPLTYQLQSFSDLMNWSALSGMEISVIPSVTLLGFEDVIFRADQAVSNDATMFVQLAAQLP